MAKDIQNLTKAEQVSAFRSSGQGFFKTLAHFLGILKILSYFSYLVVGYFAYDEAISWWWLAACFGAGVLLEHLAKSSVHSHLMKQGYDYYGVEGDRSDLGGGTVRRNDIEEAYNIVSRFGAVMEKCQYMTKFYDVKTLPFEKDKILKSLVACYEVENDKNVKENIKIGLLALTHFQENIGEKPIETVVDVLSLSLSNTGDIFEKKADELTDEEMEEIKKEAGAFLEKQASID